MKRVLNRSVVLVITVVVLMTMVVMPAFAASNFKDTLDNASKDKIAKYAGLGIIGGYSDGTFKPNALITRAEYVKIINAALGTQLKADVKQFADVKSTDWYANELLKARGAGYFDQEDNLARPNETITKGDAAVIFCKAYNIAPYPVNWPAFKTLPSLAFTYAMMKDLEVAPEYMQPYVFALFAGYIYGSYEGGGLKPLNPLTRLDAINMIEAYTLNVDMAKVNSENIDKFKPYTYIDPNNADTKSNKMVYQLYVPANYDAKKSYPLVVSLHGILDTGYDNKAPMRSLYNLGITFVRPEIQAKYESIVLVPQCPDTTGWASTDNADLTKATKAVANPNTKLLMSVIAEVESKYSIDSKREYCTGLSMGGIGTWRVNELYPDKFAAMVPVAGYGVPSEAAVKLVNKPIWAFHAADDGLVLVGPDRSTVKALKDAGSNIIYTEYEANFVPGNKHASWMITYGDDANRMIDWMFAQHLK
jgi:dienelactone hydrolase